MLDGLKQVVAWNILQASDWLVNTPGFGFVLLAILAIWIIKKIVTAILWAIVLGN